jgi:hypothetical protein
MCDGRLWHAPAPALGERCARDGPPRKVLSAARRPSCNAATSARSGSVAVSTSPARVSSAVINRVSPSPQQALSVPAGPTRGRPHHDAEAYSSNRGSSGAPPPTAERRRHMGTCAEMLALGSRFRIECALPKRSRAHARAANGVGSVAVGGASGVRDAPEEARSGGRRCLRRLELPTDDRCDPRAGQERQMSAADQLDVLEMCPARLQAARRWRAEQIPPRIDTEAGHRSVHVIHLPSCWQAPTCRLHRSASRADSRRKPRRDRAFRRTRPLGRPARQLPLVCDHVRRRTTSGRLVASIPPRRLLRVHARKRCGVARRGGRSCGRPRRWIRRGRPPRWRAPRWEFSARARVRGWPLRWTTIPSRAQRPASLRLPVLLLSLLRLRPVLSRRPIRRVLRPVFTLLRPSILLLGRSVGLRRLWLHHSRDRGGDQSSSRP